MLEAQKDIKNYQLETQFTQLRQDTHYNTVTSANKNVFWFSFIESVLVLGVTFLQIYYVKRLLEDRRAY
jgi:emp24/gp25L/p24 family/GOLD.